MKHGMPALLNEMQISDHNLLDTKICEGVEYDKIVAIKVSSKKFLHQGGRNLRMGMLLLIHAEIKVYPS